MFVKKLLDVFGGHVPLVPPPGSAPVYSQTGLDMTMEIYIYTQLQSNVTAGHNLKLANTRCLYDLRKYAFTIRVVNVWIEPQIQ